MNRVGDEPPNRLPDKYGDIKCSCEDKGGNVPDHLTNAIMAAIASLQ